MNVLKNLRPQRGTVQEIHAAIGQARAGLAEDQERLTRLVPGRRSLLLEGTDEEILQIEAQISSTRLSMERGEAAIEELQRLLGEAQVRERDAELDRLEEDTRAEEAALYEDALAYTGLAQKMVPIADRAKRRRRRIQANIIRLRDAGRTPPARGHIVQFEDRLQLPATDAVNKAFWWNGGARGEGLELLDD